tara:strand:+ start:273 stop:623 length:351 start_codon:yes stop_codon:yes gene_type:complete
MKYNGNNKETKEAILKENQPYIYENLSRYTKLDLLGIIDHRSDALDTERMSNIFSGKAVINVYVDNEHAHEVFFEPECTEINVNDVFAIADKYENMYIDYHDVKTDVIFTRSYSRI